MSLKNISGRVIHVGESHIEHEQSFNITNRTGPCISYIDPETNKTGIILLRAVNKKKFVYNEILRHYPVYLKKWLNIHENQYRAGQEIINKYLKGTSRYVILVAQMQSGKTGTAKYVVHYLRHCHHKLPFNPDRCYFICGMNDNDLRNQAVTEFKNLISPDNILFSKQLQKLNSQNKKLPKRQADLVIIDESHYAGGVNSQIDKFLKHTETNLTLSISATAMAEIATAEKNNKPVVYLEPGPGYFGIADLFRQGMISQSFSLSSETQKFLDLVAEQYDNQMECEEPRYNLVRLPNQFYFEDMEEALEELDLDINYINHHTEFMTEHNVTDFNQYLQHKPEKFTIIWIYNSLRAGKQLNTQYIGFVHDTSHSQTDTISQSLMGRIFGYNKSDNNVECYTDLKSARKMLWWVNNHYDAKYIPQGSRDIIRGYHGRKVKWQTHPPILVVLPTLYREYYRDLKEKHRNRYPYKDELLYDLASVSIGDETKLEDIFDNYHPGKYGGLMVLWEFNKQRSFHEQWFNNYQSYLRNKPCGTFEAKTKFTTAKKFYYVFVNLNKYSKQFGYAVILYKELVNDKIESDYVAVSDKSRFRDAN